MVKTIVRLEGLLFFLLGLTLYWQLGGNLLWFFVFLFVPDISMVGYRIDKKLGALLYNLMHNYITALAVLFIGLITGSDVLSFAGLIIFSHVGIDRLFGYGLKYETSFKDTHLQRL